MLYSLLYAHALSSNFMGGVGNEIKIKKYKNTPTLTMEVYSNL